MKSKSLANIRERVFPWREAKDSIPVPDVPTVTKGAIGSPTLLSTSHQPTARAMGLSTNHLAQGGDSQHLDTIIASESMPASTLTSPRSGAGTGTRQPLSTPKTPQTEASTSASVPNSSPTSHKTKSSAAMSSPAGIKETYPRGDPHVAKRAEYPPIEYSKLGKATALHSHPAGHDQIEYDRKSMATAAPKKRAMGPKEAEHPAHGKAKTAEQDSIFEAKQAEKQIYADIPEEHLEAPKGSPMKKMTNALGSKIKGVFSKKEK